MIIEGLLNMIIGLFESVLGFIHIPQIDSGIVEAAHNTFSSMVEYANNLIGLAMPYHVARAFLVIIIAVEVGIEIYAFVLWVLKKIPVAGIE